MSRGDGPTLYIVVPSIGEGTPLIDLAASLMLTIATTQGDPDALSTLIAAEFHSVIDGLDEAAALAKVCQALVAAAQIGTLLAALAADVLDPDSRLTPAAVIHGAREQLLR